MEKEQRAIVELIFFEKEPISALDFSSFIFDFNRLYVYCLRSIRNIPITSSFHRSNFVLPNEDKIIIRRLRHESPLLMEIGAVLAATLAAIQIIQTLKAWPLAQKKLELEVEKLDLEVNNLRQLGQTRRGPVENIPQIYNAAGSLARNPLQPNEIGVKIDRRV